MMIADRYELGEVIGTGGMSDVYAATDTLIGRGVAVKILKIDLARDVSFRERFRREAQNSGRLNHPAIVSVFDTGETIIEGLSVPFIVMERVFGRTLRDVIREDGPMPPRDAASFLIPAAHALQASHEAGIIHRDVKPANVMITNTGAVKVMDFGIARALDDSTSAMTQTAAVIGTAQYLSPEQARGRNADARSDVYSLGCVFYELITGRPPFQGETPFAVAYQHVQEEPEPPSRYIAGLSPAEAVNIDAVVLTAMAKHPADRYQSAADLADDLELVSRGAVTHAARTHIAPAEDPNATTRVDLPAQPETRPAAAAVAHHERPESPRRRWPTYLAAILAAIVLGVGGLFAWDVLSNRNDDPGRENTAHSDLVKIPPLEGKSRSEATRILEDLGLVVDVVEEPHPAIPVDRVIRTSPDAGSSLRKESSVQLTVSSGEEMTRVPALEGLTLAEASSALERAGLILEPEVAQQASSDVPEGHIISHMPDANAELPKGSKVSVTMSSGPELVRVPALEGTDLAQAQATLDSLGLAFDIAYIDSSAPRDRVLGVSNQGERVPRGTAVTLQASNNELFKLPDVTHMTADEAVNALRSAGWTGSRANLQEGQKVPTTVVADRGRIAAQQPAQGTELRKDAPLNVQYWDFPELKDLIP